MLFRVLILAAVAVIASGVEELKGTEKLALSPGNPVEVKPIVVADPVPGSTCDGPNRIMCVRGKEATCVGGSWQCVDVKEKRTGWILMPNDPKSRFVNDMKSFLMKGFPKGGLVKTSVQSVDSIRFEGLSGGTLFEVVATILRGPGPCTKGKMCLKMPEQISTQKFLVFQTSEKKFQLVQAVDSPDLAAQLAGDLTAIDASSAEVQYAIQYAVNPKRVMGVQHCSSVTYAASQYIPGSGTIYMITAQVNTKAVVANPGKGSCNVRDIAVLAADPPAEVEPQATGTALRGAAPPSDIAVGSPIPLFKVITGEIKKGVKCTMPLPCDAQGGAVPMDPLPPTPRHPMDPLPPMVSCYGEGRCENTFKIAVCGKDGKWSCQGGPGPVVISDPVPPAPVPAPAPAPAPASTTDPASTTSAKLSCLTGMTGRGIWISPIDAPGPASQYSCVSYCQVCEAGQPGTCAKAGMVGCCQAGTSQSVYGSMSKQMLMTSRFSAAMKLQQCDSNNCNSVSSGPSC